MSEWMKSVLGIIANAIATIATVWGSTAGLKTEVAVIQNNVDHLTTSVKNLQVEIKRGNN